MASTLTARRKAALAAAPGSRKGRERARRCTEVLAVARALFTSKGYQQTAMVEIAAGAEVALGTLYQLFASKEEILCRLLEAQVDALLERLREAVAGERDPRAQVERLVRTQLALLRDNADVLRLYLSGLIGYDVTLRQKFGRRLDRKYHEYLDVLTGVFRHGVRTRAFVARPPRHLAMLLAGMINAVVRGWMHEPHGDLDAVADDLVAVFFTGATVRRRARGRE